MHLVQSLGFFLAGAAIGAVSFERAQATQAQTPITAGPGNQPTYFVEHPDHVQPGLPNHGRWAALTNPYAGNTQRIAEGAKLFVAYNCLDCHGGDGSGAMGPSLQ